MKRSTTATENELFRGHGVLKFALPAVLALAALGFSLAGWMSSELFKFSVEQTSDFIIRFIRSFLFQGGRPPEGGHWASHVGKVFAGLTTASGALLLGFAAAREMVVLIAARYLLSSHMVVVGDTLIARRIAEQHYRDGDRVVQLVPESAQKVLPFGVARIRLGLEKEAVLNSGVERARLVFIDAGDIAQTLGIGHALLQRVDAEAYDNSIVQRLRRLCGRTRPDRIVLHVPDVLIASEFADLVHSRGQEAGGGPARFRPAILDENRLTARQVLGAHPLFKIAAARGQPRVNAVLIGYGKLAEQLLDQIMLTSVAGALGTPRVTILTTDAEGHERSFRARRPPVADTLDIAFVDIDVRTGLDPSAPAPESMRRLLEDERASLTAIYVTADTDEGILRTVMQLRRLRERAGWFDAAIFYAPETDAAGDLFGAVPDDLKRTDRVIRMPAPSESISKAIVDSDNVDRLAALLHEKYSEKRPPNEAVSWQGLSETLRRANIRSCDHLPAKLWTLGIDYSGLDDAGFPILTGTARTKLRDLLVVENRALSQDTWMALAALEHERWIIDRKLDGWRYGTPRDNRRLIHPLIIPWAELQKEPDEVIKDLDQVFVALEFVAGTHAGQDK